MVIVSIGDFILLRSEDIVVVDVLVTAVEAER